MNALVYIFRSLHHFKKQHFAIFLATVLSTAVLTGALIVGDSVKYSLNQLVTKRLGAIEFAMQTNDRFVTDTVCAALGNQLNTHVSGVLKLSGVAINSDLDVRLNAVEILGIDDSFWKLANVYLPHLTDNEAFISENVAKKLNLKVGDEVLIRVKNTNVIPINTAFSVNNQASVAIRYTISVVLDANHFGLFNLKSDQKAPFTIWVSKSQLGKKMKLENKINTLLVSGNKNALDEQAINNVFEKVWKLDDAGLTIDTLEQSQLVELTSERVFIDSAIAEKVIEYSDAEGMVTFLVNGITFKANTTPYSFVSGVSNQVAGTHIAENEIILNQWCATDLGVQVADSVTLNYYVLGAYQKLYEQSNTFVVKAIEPNQGKLFVQNLTPDFPGLSDAVSCSQWETGIPINLDKIRDNDEDFWNRYKATPKAVIGIETAVRLWGNPYGKYTALRFNAHGESMQSVKNKIIKCIKPTDIGLYFTNVKANGQRAASNGVDFGQLFLSLSFFVISAALLLLVLMYSLHIASRKAEVGILSSLGFSQRRIFSLFLAESVPTIVVGAILGVIVGIAYNILVLKGLNTLWRDAVRTEMLQVCIQPSTLVLGGAIGVLLSLFSVYLIIRKHLRLQAAQLLKRAVTKDAKNSLNQITALLFLFTGLGLLLFSLLSKQLLNAELFLTSGACILVSLLAIVNHWLKRQSALNYNMPMSRLNLAFKNMALNRTRSLLAISLLSLGMFAVIVTAANRKTFYGAANQRQSGTGGFLFWVENSILIIHDLNSTAGKSQMGFDAGTIADSIQFIQFYSLNGDDASCLNLNQVQQSRILGVNVQIFEQLNPFKFAQLIDGANEGQAWSELSKTYGENCIPAFVDQTVITWGLMKKIGDTLLYNNEYGTILKLLIAGGLENSVFQGNILISNAHFRKHFPSQAGSNVMLIEGNAQQSNQISEFIETHFKDYGLTCTLTTVRLAEFNSVENTYLNVFMLLGGLGVVIGTIGFGIVLLRNKLERKRELALFSALGFYQKQLFMLLFVEHFMLLLVGLGSGILAAFVAILPSFVSPSFSLPVVFILGLILLIFGSGLLSILLTARFSNKTNLIEALRNE